MKTQVILPNGDHLTLYIATGYVTDLGEISGLLHEHGLTLDDVKSALDLYGVQALGNGEIVVPVTSSNAEALIDALDALRCGIIGVASIISYLREGKGEKQ